MTQITELLRDVTAAFPRQELRSRTLEVYERELTDLPLEVLEDAIRWVLRSSEWFPTIRAIREAVAERMLLLPSEAQALQQIEARIGWGRSQDGDPPPVHALVEEVATRVGGFSIFRTADEPNIIRGQFGRLYREERTLAIAAARVGA